MSTLLLALAIAAPASKGDGGLVAVQSIEGEWIVEQEVSSGKPILNLSKPTRVTIRRDRWKSRIEGELEWGLTVDRKKDPPHIDLWDPDKKNAGTKGIFKLEGNTLIIYYRFGDIRPAKFESLPKSGVRMMTLKRVKKN